MKLLIHLLDLIILFAVCWVTLQKDRQLHISCLTGGTNHISTGVFPVWIHTNCQTVRGGTLSRRAGMNRRVSFHCKQTETQRGRMTSVWKTLVSRDRPPPKLSCCQLMIHLNRSRITSTDQTQETPFYYSAHTHPEQTHTHSNAADWHTGVFSPWEMDAQCHCSEFTLHQKAARKNWRVEHESKVVSQSLQSEATGCFYAELQEIKSPQKTPLNPSLQAANLQPQTYTVFYYPQSYFVGASRQREVSLPKQSGFHSINRNFVFPSLNTWYAVL